MEDADGSLLVIDTGGWFLYGCPTSAISRPEIKGGIYRIRKDAARLVQDVRGLQLDWNHPQIDWLDDDRFAVRDRAKTELAKQGEKIIPALEEILTNAHTTERHCREAIWTLNRIDHPRARAAVTEALFDRSASVRLTAARSCSVWRERGAVAHLELIIRSGDEPQVVREAATALGRIGTVGSPIEALFEAVGKNAGRDPYLDHSLIDALIELGNWNHQRAFLSHADGNVQRAALISCAEMKANELKAEQLAPFLSAADPELRAEALRLATARPEWGGSLVDFLKKSLEAEQLANGVIDALLAFSGNTGVQNLLAESLGGSATARTTALQVMNGYQEKSPPQSWTVALIQSLADHPDTATIEAIGHLGISAADTALVGISSDSELSKNVRLTAFDVAADRLPATLAPELFELAAACLQPNQPTQLRIDAARVLARAPLNDAQLLACTEQLIREAGPLQIGPLLGVFEGKKLSAETSGALADALQASPGLFSIPSARLDKIFASHKAAAAPLLEKIRAAESQREQRLGELGSAIAGHQGDAERGKMAFAKATCVVCHKAKGEGGIIGPEPLRRL